MQYAYATLFELREYMRVSSADTDDDTELTRWLLTASRIIEARCRRRFDIRYETIWHDVPTLITPYGMQILDYRNLGLRLASDLIELVSVTNGDLTSILTTDITIHPIHIYPKNLLKIKPSSDSSWASSSDGNTEQVIGVTGWWGFHKQIYSMFVDSNDILGAAINASVTTMTVTDYDGVSEDGVSPRFQIGQILKIDDELILVTDIASLTNTISIIRGYNESIAATHAKDAPILIFRPMSNIKLATMLYALWRYRQSGADTEGTAAVLESEDTITISPKLPRNIIDLLPAPRPILKG